MQQNPAKNEIFLKIQQIPSLKDVPIVCKHTHRKQLYDNFIYQANC